MILLVVGKAQDLVAVRPPLMSMGCLCRLLCVQAMMLIHQTPICLSSATNTYTVTISPWTCLISPTLPAAGACVAGCLGQADAAFPLAGQQRNLERFAMSVQIMGDTLQVAASVDEAVPRLSMMDRI